MSVCVFLKKIVICAEWALLLVFILYSQWKTHENDDNISKKILNTKKKPLILSLSD